MMDNVRYLRAVTDTLPPLAMSEADSHFDALIEVLRESHENTRQILAWGEEIQRRRLTG